MAYMPMLGKTSDAVWHNKIKKVKEKDTKTTKQNLSEVSQRLLKIISRTCRHQRFIFYNVMPNYNLVC